jgi:hypothetical protein
VGFELMILHTFLWWHIFGEKIGVFISMKTRKITKCFLRLTAGGKYCDLRTYAIVPRNGDVARKQIFFFYTLMNLAAFFRVKMYDYNPLIDAVLLSGARFEQEILQFFEIFYNYEFLQHAFFLAVRLEVRKVKASSILFQNDDALTADSRKIDANIHVKIIGFPEIYSPQTNAAVFYPIFAKHIPM